ncbi:MAG: ISAs1 family transposase [Pseudonocardia sp.]
MPDAVNLIAEAPAAEDLLVALLAVSDPRQSRGVRHRLLTVLAAGVCAVLAGARSYVMIAEWAHDLPVSVRLRLGIGLRGAPSESTFRRILQRVDPDEPEAPRSGEGRAVHLLGALDHASGVVLGQTAVDQKINEITAFTPLLERIDTACPLAGAVITADALHTQHAHAEWLHARGAHYVFIAKGNQPTLHAQLADLPWTSIPV